jgi:hypothetical protein
LQLLNIPDLLKEPFFWMAFFVLYKISLDLVKFKSNGTKGFILRPGGQT